MPGDTIDNMFALGDVAESGGPNMARAADVQSHIVASNIVSLIKNNKAPHNYQPVKEVEGSIKLTLGKVCDLKAASRRAVANDTCQPSLQWRCTQKMTAEMML
jgi:NADH dehydrogenase FAD-containing subunit